MPCLLLCGISLSTSLSAATLPVQAFMVAFPKPGGVAPFVDFIRHDLPREGVTHLIVEIDYDYQFKSRPELTGAVTEGDVKSVVSACRETGVKLIPLVNCLGHQSWAKTTFRLLTAHPEFDETPGLYPENEGIYCRSYCPNHPGVHAVVFDVLAEIANVFEADELHVGMDEVFLIGEDACPRCAGGDPAALFAQEVRTLHGFLTNHGIRMWMWADRLVDGRTTGLGKWEASMNNTARAIDLVPRDIVLCDWHYTSAPPTAAYFATKGFEVVSCSWNQPKVAVAQADQIITLRQRNADGLLGTRFLGVMSTSWGGTDRFLEELSAARSHQTGEKPTSADSFLALFSRLRTQASLAEGDELE